MKSLASFRKLGVIQKDAFLLEMMHLLTASAPVARWTRLASLKSTSFHMEWRESRREWDSFYAQRFYILRINSPRHAPWWCVISNGKNETTLLPCTYVQCHAMYVVFDFVEALHPYATHTWLRSDSTMCVSLQLQYWSYKCSVGFYDDVEDKTSHFRGCANGHPSRDYLRCFQNPEHSSWPIGQLLKYK